MSHAGKDNANIFSSAYMLWSKVGNMKKNREQGVCPVSEGAFFIFSFGVSRKFWLSFRKGKASLRS